jgi:DNA invertase Pin-like site-specific DNA recombinase
VPKVAEQLADLRKLAKARGYVVVDEFSDDGLSAAVAENRPDFDRLMAALPMHPSGVILATEEARLARNNGEKLALTVQCATHGVTWETVRDGFVDPSEPAGEFMAAIRGAVDTLESKRKAQRQRAANAHRREKGLYFANGPVPFGWNEDRVTICEEEAALVRRGVAEVLSGMNFNTIVRTWREDPSVPPPRRAEAWTRIAVMSLLKRWRNAGVVAYYEVPLRDESAKGKVKPYKIGDWKPIVSVKELEDVRSLILTRKGAKRTASRLCSGVACCACGAYMLASGANGSRAYMCSSRVRGLAQPDSVHTGIKAEMLDAMVRDAVVDNYFLVPAGSGVEASEANALRDLYMRRSEAQAAIARLADQVDAGTFKPAEIQPKVAKRRLEIDDIETEIARLTAQSAHAAMLQAAMAQWTAEVPSTAIVRRNGRIDFDADGAWVELRVTQGATREQAVNELVADYWQQNPEEMASVRAELAARFEELPLEQQRTLVQSLLKIKILPFRDERGERRQGADRVVIESNLPQPRKRKSTERTSWDDLVSTLSYLTTVAHNAKKQGDTETAMDANRAAGTISLLLEARDREFTH